MSPSTGSKSGDRGFQTFSLPAVAVKRRRSGEPKNRPGVIAGRCSIPSLLTIRDWLVLLWRSASVGDHVTRALDDERPPRESVTPLSLRRGSERLRNHRDSCGTRGGQTRSRLFLLRVAVGSAQHSQSAGRPLDAQS